MWLNGENNEWKFSIYVTEVQHFYINSIQWMTINYAFDYDVKIGKQLKSLNRLNQMKTLIEVKPDENSDFDCLCLSLTFSWNFHIVDRKLSFMLIITQI